MQNFTVPLSICNAVNPSSTSVVKMAQKRKSGYTTSDHFVVDDDDQTHSPEPSSKRPKKTADTASTHFSSDLKPKRDKENNLFWEISKARRVTVSDFRGKKMIHIREYYDKDGEMLPGKKGIGITLEQYASLLAVLPGIENELRRSGIQDVPRPNYQTVDSGDGPVKGERAEESDDSAEQADGRANHEATSDEEE